MCSAALAAQNFEEVHLLTFLEQATIHSPWPIENKKRLEEKYPQTTFIFNVFSTDKIVSFLSYQGFLKNICKFHFYNLVTPGLSSLSWHIRTISYCLEHNIKVVFDGMTKELLHLPGHMPEIRVLFQKLYSDFDIEFSSMVIDWEVPEDQRFMDRLIVDRHGFSILPARKSRTTGEWLYEQGLLPHKNVKGSEFDRLMQHDCYPFIVYNMLVFWFFEPLIGLEAFKLNLEKFMTTKVQQGKFLLEQGSNLIHSKAENA